MMKNEPPSATVCAGVVLAGISLLFAPCPVSAQSGTEFDQDTVRPVEMGVQTGIPERGRRALAEGEQSASDMDIARRIRSSLLADDALSAYAHNVKILARNGQVILRGPVRSENERAIVDEKAAAVVGRDNVRNEVEITPARIRE